MPAGCVSMSTNTSVSVVNGKKHTKVTKKYTMADGSTKTEVEETISGWDMFKNIKYDLSKF